MGVTLATAVVRGEGPMGVTLATALSGTRGRVLWVRHVLCLRYDLTYILVLLPLLIVV